jgi:hypothetical protein
MQKEEMRGQRETTDEKGQPERVAHLKKYIPHTRAMPHSPNDRLWDRRRLAIDACAWSTCAHDDREREKDAAVRAEHRRKDEGAHSRSAVPDTVSM